MKTKMITTIMITLFLASMLSMAFNMAPVAAETTLYIDSDYTFTSNIYEPIVVTADNIVIDGDGYTLQGPDSGWTYGFYLNGRSGVTIKNVIVEGWYGGISLYWSSGNTISGNTVSYNEGDGIYLDDCSGNSISGNTVSYNSYWGIYLDDCSGNTISGNTVSHNGWDGIMLAGSSGNSISGNTVSYNEWGGIELGYYSNGNSISGNTVSYNEGDGIELWSLCSGNTISGNTVSYNDFGIVLFMSWSNSISGNTVSNNRHWVAWGGWGIYLYWSDGNTISGNTVASNDGYGIYLLHESSGNTIYYNNIIDNYYGMYLESYIFDSEEYMPANNIIYHNNFIDNAIQAYDENPVENDWHHPDLLEGNYWSDYLGTDDGSGTGKHAIAGDGIGDTNIPWPELDYDYYPFIHESGWIISPPTAGFTYSPVSPDEGSVVSFTDASTDVDGTIVSWSWSFGDGGTSTLQNPTHTFEDNGVYTVSLTVTDDDGLTDTKTTDVTVNNVDPTADAGPDQMVDEGSTVYFSGTFTDPGTEDTHTIVWDFGDGSPVATGMLTLAHVYADAGTYAVSLTVTDDDGGAGTDTLTVIVDNVAPTVGPIDAPYDPVEVDTSITVSATFADPGVLDTHTASWDWGDGALSPGVVSEADGSGTVTGSYVYSNPGVYTINLIVIDDDGGVGSTLFEYAVVYDAEGGFVTGGGWIDSPEGAYTLDPTLSGKASFGFVSKYKKGASTPSGQTEFIFHVADLNFHSTSYQWLVIAGPRAQFKGSGTINGEGDYGFMLIANDGQVNGGGGVDGFRIKIWDKGTGEVIYDNQLDDADDADASDAIESGSIVIHKK